MIPKIHGSNFSVTQEFTLLCKGGVPGVKYFLAYVDILGFEEIPKEVARESVITPEEVRKTYRNRVENRLKKTKDVSSIVHFPEFSPDSWLLFADDVWKLLRSVGEVLKADLPFEITIGVEEYKVSPMGEESINLCNETVSFVKDAIDISNSYKLYMKEQNKEVRDTFILATRELYDELNYKKIFYKDYLVSNKGVPFHLVKANEFERTLEILEFLKEIGSERKEYREIDELYVEPKNYQKIKKILDKNNMVFIIGDPEIGKTFTAIRLLLKFSKKYDPVYIPEENKIDQWQLIRHTGERGLQGKVIYLEDTWGKVAFEKVDSLFRDIGTFIAEAKRQECKIILTSRERIFKEFEKRKETAEDLWKYVSRLRVDLAYTKEDLIQMLRKYLNVFEPVWGHNENLKDIATDAIDRKLRTPFSIKKLMDYSIDADHESKLLEAIEKAAQETKIAFARETKELFNRGQYDSIIFLSFSYIGIRTHVAKTCYEIVLTDLRERDLEYSLLQARPFDDLIEEFNEVEISTVGLKYVHPSYRDGFGFALTDEGKFNNIYKKIFSPVLFRLSEKDEAAGDVASFIADNFDILPEDERNKLLMRLSEIDEAAWFVVMAVADNFDELAEDVKNRLILILSQKDEAVEDVGRILADNFNRIPHDIRNELLLILSEKDVAAAHVSRAVAIHFGKIPEDVRNTLLLTLFEREEAIKDAARAVAENYEKLPEDVQQLLFRLSGRDKSAPHVAKAIADNFNKLPEEARNLLFWLSTSDAAARAVARGIAENFDKFPRDDRNKLLLSLSDKDEAAEDIGITIADNFYEIPNDLRDSLLPKLFQKAEMIILLFKVLFRLSEKEEAWLYVARAIAIHFNRLPEHVRSLLFRLARRKETARHVATVVAENFDKLPEDARSLLFTLADWEQLAPHVALVVAENFDKLPEDARSLLFRLAEREETGRQVARALAVNLDKLPKDAKNLLFRLWEKDYVARYMAWALKDDFSVLQEHVRSELLLKLCERSESVDVITCVVACLLAYDFYQLPSDVKNRVLVALSKKDGAEWFVARTVSSSFNRFPNDIRDLLFNLSQKESAAGALARAVADNFHELPKSVRNALLLRLSEKDQATSVVARVVEDYFDKLPQRVRIRLLDELSRKDENAPYVVRVIIDKFDKLPKDIRNLLFRFSAKDKTAQYVAKVLAGRAEKLPKDIINRLLLRLSEKDEAAEDVAKAIVNNFDKLSEDVRNLLPKLQPKGKKKKQSAPVSRI